MLTPDVAPTWLEAASTYRCTTCSEIAALHRSRYRVDANRVIGLYCTPHCADRDGDYALASAVSADGCTWIALNEHNEHCAPWSPAPLTLAQRLAREFRLSRNAGLLLQLLAERPERLLAPGTLIAAAQIDATSGAERVLLSSVLADGYLRTSGDPVTRSRETIAPFLSRTSDGNILDDRDLLAAAGWLAEQGIQIPQRRDRAELVVLAHRSEHGWLLPSGVARLSLHPPSIEVKNAMVPDSVRASALQQLLEAMPDHVRVCRFDRKAAVETPAIAVSVARRLFAPRRLGPLPPSAAADVFGRLSTSLQHPAFEHFAPSVELALKWLSGTIPPPEDVNESVVDEASATRLLARTLAAPYTRDDGKQTDALPRRRSAIGLPILQAGLDETGRVVLDPSSMRTPLAWVIDAGEWVVVEPTDNAVTVSDTPEIAPARIRGIVAGNSIQLISQPAALPPVPLSEAEGVVVPLTSETDGSWIGVVDGTEQLVIADGSIPLQRTLVRGGKHVSLPERGTVLARSIAFALEFPPDHVSPEVVLTNENIDARLRWGPLDLGVTSANSLLIARSRSDAPMVRLRIGDGPRRANETYVVLDEDEDAVLLGMRDGDVAGSVSISRAEAALLLSVTPQVGDRVVLKG